MILLALLFAAACVVLLRHALIEGRPGRRWSGTCQN